EHDIVGHVDNWTDRPHAGTAQALTYLQGRRRPVVDTANDATYEGGATRGSVEIYGKPIVSGSGSHRRQARSRQRLTRQRRNLARNADNRHGIATVRRDVE